MLGPRVLRAPDTLFLGAALLVSLIAAGMVVKAPPLLVVGAAALFIMIVSLGMEALIAVSFLGGCGLIPFVDPNHFVTPQIKSYAFLFLISFGAMIVTWAGRELVGRENWALPVNAISLGLVALLCYVLMAALATHPLQVPALTTPFFILPLSGLGVILWLSHEEALQGLRKAVPLVILIAAAWSLAYDAGAAGCGPCRAWVGTEVTNVGFFGAGSRLYTSGQNSLLALFVICFAYTLYRPGLLPISLTTLGAITIALQSSRAQYIGVFVAMAVLIAWKFQQLPSGGRVALVVLCSLILLSLALSPVGHRAVSAYTELNQGQGTGTYRLKIIDQTAKNWTIFGHGFSTHSLGLGYDVDLGLPNTILILGYVGAVLQLTIVGAAIWRGLKAGTLVGVTIAAILLMVLVTRPSLPLLEYGHSAVMYGGVLGAAAVLAVRQRSRPARSRYI